MIYRKTVIINVNAAEKRYVVGVEACTQIAASLPNHRQFAKHNLVFFSALNPWGLKGDTLESIADYLVRLDSHSPNYDRPFDGKIPLLRKTENRIPFKGNPYASFTTEPLSFSELWYDVKEALNQPLNLDSDALLYMGTHKETTKSWNSWITDCDHIHNYLISEGLVFSETSEKKAMSPYYIIQFQDGHYLAKPLNVGVAFAAKQFPVKESALNYIKRNGSSLQGCVPIEISPTPLNIVRYR